MRRFSAQYIFTNCGPPLKRAVVEVENDGTIISITDTEGDLKETGSVEFFNGIIIPGFINCHCHLELSHLKNKISNRKGLGEFIKQIRTTRDADENEIVEAAVSADKELYRGGVELCADICNTALTFGLKKESNIIYFNLIEVFGIDPQKAEKRIMGALSAAKAAEDLGLRHSIVPHAVYSVSLPLFDRIRKITGKNSVTSIHFMESDDEALFLKSHSGPVMTSYRESGLAPSVLMTASDHADAILHHVTSSGNLILVHNTFITGDIIKVLNQRKNIFWCLCPNSNLHIENHLPPADLLSYENCTIILGTDSLASNKSLSMMEELKTLQYHFPGFRLDEMIRWATINGAKALCMDDSFGKIKPGIKPGLILLQNVDILNLKLLPGSTATRLM